MSAISAILALIIPSFATFYAAYVLTNTSGPYGVFTAVREKLPLGGLTSCFKCAILWFALGFFLLYRTTPDVVIVFAIPGIALSIFRYTGGSANV